MDEITDSSSLGSAGRCVLDELRGYVRELEARSSTSELPKLSLRGRLIDMHKQLKSALQHAFACLSDYEAYANYADSKAMVVWKDITGDFRESVFIHVDRVRNASFHFFLLFLPRFALWGSSQASFLKKDLEKELHDVVLRQRLRSSCGLRV